MLCFSAVDQDLPVDEDEGEAQAFKVYLECFQYLKIFSIWGHETLAELKNDPDTYEHIADLWNQLSLSNTQAEQVCQADFSSVQLQPDVNLMNSLKACFVSLIQAF